MDFDQTAFNLIATSLSKHYDSIYYIDIETGEFSEFVHSKLFEKLCIPKEGRNFYKQSIANAAKYVHPDDLQTIITLHEKKTIQRFLENNDFYSATCRLIIDGTIIHVRHVFILCDDKKHILACMENIEAEHREKTEQKKNLQSAERMARRDELTGIKNKNAFTEYSQSINDKLKAGLKDLSFGVVMCDVNNLKHINDTRGHSFGDEAIQRTSRMICDIFKHSPVFRTGGDEFVAILTGTDFEHRESLLNLLREESLINGRLRTGPVVASGLSVYEPDKDCDFCSVFRRADQEMYENKTQLKNQTTLEAFRTMDEINEPIPDDRRRMLNSLFEALITIAGDGYVFLNDMSYDYSRWSLALVDDFGLNSEYMYHADQIWKEYIHPDDMDTYNKAVEAVLYGNAELKPIYYRARKPDGSYVLLTTRGFVLCDGEGKPDYFGGIIIRK